MSRLGKLPIKLPAGTSASLEGETLKLKGAKGELGLKINSAVELKIENGEISVSPKDKTAKDASALWGLVWSLTRNAVMGVSQGFSKKLEINGVGYRAAVAPGKINLSLGFSHPVEFKLPAGLTAVMEGTAIVLTSANKQLLGEIAAQIRRLRPPEPYKGKGIKYSTEIIRRKAGKSAVKGAK